MEEKIVFKLNEGQKNVFQPDVEICFQQEQVSRDQLKELLGMELVDPSIGPDLTLCSNRECEPPYGVKETCGVYQDSICTAASAKE